MKLGDFDVVLRYIEDFEDPLSPRISADYLERIHHLIDGSRDRWQELYELTSEVEINYCPWLVGIPEEDWNQDQVRNQNRSVVQILLDNVDDLSGPDWFDCAPPTWLGIFAASALGNGISMYQIVNYALSTADGPIDDELLQKLPRQMPLNYLKANEALVAAEVFELQDERLRHTRQSHAARGGQERNRPYVVAHQEFIEFYLAHSHLSRAEAARRFHSNMLADLGPRDRPLYRNEECAVRALRAALKAAGI